MQTRHLTIRIDLDQAIANLIYYRSVENVDQSQKSGGTRSNSRYRWNVLNGGSKMKVWKLPQARLYLDAARWGIDELVDQKYSGYPFRFFLVGILASLRAVQHALKHHDRNISPAHKKVIDEWWNDPNAKAAPELKFIETSRNLILKKGALDAEATHSESGTGEGENRIVLYEEYDLVCNINGEHLDLHEQIRKAIAWCDRELASIEAKLPEPG
jgi:hypothetical protein